MDELTYVYLTAAVIVAYFLASVLARRFDPFAPIWLFFVGYVQVYVVQALHYHDWAVAVRGKDLVASANLRALWALLWFLAVYHLSPARGVSAILPRPPRTWSPGFVAFIAPLLAVWGLYCSILVLRGLDATAPASGEASLLTNFPFTMLVGAILLIVTGRDHRSPRLIFLAAGLVIAAGYVLIWMFNGKRSHSLIGVLTSICAWYIARFKRPSWPVLISTAFVGSLVVAIAIGWRNDRDHPRSLGGFVAFLADFRVSRILESLDVADGEEEIASYETWEYGGFLLMMDTVPAKSDYDYGANYIRTVSTFIPRVIWANKPIFGRKAWENAWIAGSEMEREEGFSGPAISLLGATQLNGGAPATAIVVACVALFLRTAYEYFRRHCDVLWVQFWWAISFFNAWFIVVCDDPMVWFYYNWGFSTFPTIVLMWWANRLAGSSAPREAAAVPAAAGVAARAW